MQGDAKHPKAPLGNNFRPPQPLHHRPVRTNIDFNVRHPGDVSCFLREWVFESQWVLFRKWHLYNEDFSSHMNIHLTNCDILS